MSEKEVENGEKYHFPVILVILVNLSKDSSESGDSDNFGDSMNLVIGAGD